MGSVRLAPRDSSSLQNAPHHKRKCNDRESVGECSAPCSKCLQALPGEECMKSYCQSNPIPVGFHRQGQSHVRYLRHGGQI